MSKDRELFMDKNDVMKKLQERIKNCRRKMNLAKCIGHGICFASAGGILGLFCELFSLCIPFYYAHFAAGLCFAAGLACGAGYGIYRRADMKQAALRLDSFGLKERMITAWEQKDQETEWTKRQRQDALFHYEQKKEQIKVRIFPDKKHIFALILSAAAVIGVGFIPSPVREQAKLLHQVKEQAKEEKEALEDLLEALESVDRDSLTEEQKARLEELSEAMQRSKEELSKADSWESLGSATERLSYKYEQAGQSLEKLASEMQNPEQAGIASAEALAKAMSGRDMGQMASAETSGSENSGKDNDGSTGNSENNAGENGGPGGQEGDGSGTGAGNSDGGQNGEEDGNGNGQNGKGTGNGQGSGEGNGQGSGTGGDGDGTGNGRGTGSSDAVHDYVSIPNGIGEDSSLTGNKTGDQNSEYYREKNGLAWEGEHVDYNSVIGKYTDNAYEGIAKGRYPSGMEPVIRDYFENLNK